MYVLYACLRDNVKIVTGSVQIVLTARAVTVKKQLKQNKKKPRYWATNCERSQCHSCAYLKIKLSWYRIGLDPRLLTLFYTGDLGTVVSHVMVLLPYRFSL